MEKYNLYINIKGKYLGYGRKFKTIVKRIQKHKGIFIKWIKMVV